MRALPCRAYWWFTKHISAIPTTAYHTTYTSRITTKNCFSTWNVSWHAWARDLIRGTRVGTNYISPGTCTPHPMILQACPPPSLCLHRPTAPLVPLSLCFLYRFLAVSSASNAAPRSAPTWSPLLLARGHAQLGLQYLAPLLYISIPYLATLLLAEVFLTFIHSLGSFPC